MPAPRRWTRRLLLAGAVTLVVAAIVAQRLYGTPSEADLDRRRLQTSALNLKRIGVALMTYAERYGGGVRYPDRIEALYERGLLDDPQLLVCPAAAALGQPEPHYRYLGGRRLSDPCGSDLDRTGFVLGHAGTPMRYHEDGKVIRFGLFLRSDLTRGHHYSNIAGELERRRTLIGSLRAAPSGELAAAAQPAAGRFDPQVLAELAARAQGGQPPDETARRAFEAALEARHPEVALQGALGLLPGGHRGAARRLIKLLDRRALTHAGFRVDGPRRRWLLERLHASAPVASPRPLFAYHPRAHQHQALQDWERALRED